VLESLNCDTIWGQFALVSPFQILRGNSSPDPRDSHPCPTHPFLHLPVCLDGTYVGGLCAMQCNLSPFRDNPSAFPVSGGGGAHCVLDGNNDGRVALVRSVVVQRTEACRVVSSANCMPLCHRALQCSVRFFSRPRSEG